MRERRGSVDLAFLARWVASFLADLGVPGWRGVDAGRVDMTDALAGGGGGFDSLLPVAVEVL